MKITADRVDDATLTSTCSVEQTAPAETVEASPQQSTKVEPDLPNVQANERVVGRGASSTRARGNTPPVLVRLHRYRRNAQEECKVRTVRLEQAREANQAALEREEEKRKLFAEFAADTYVGGIVQDWQRIRHEQKNEAEERFDFTAENYDHEEKVRYEDRDLRQREAEIERAEREKIEIQGAEDRWREQREMEQQALEDRVRQERDLIESRSESRSRSTGRDYERYDEFRDEERYYEHNYLRRRDD